MVKMRYKDLIKTSSSYKQIDSSIRAMTKYYKPGIIEQMGVRIAETTNDTFTMGFLQELFKGVFDGFISPRLYSPFHTEKHNSMSPEIIIFNPMASEIKEMTTYPNSNSNSKHPLVSQIKIKDIISSTSNLILIDKSKKEETELDMKLDFAMCGGAQKGEHYLDTADELLNSKDGELSTIYKEGIKIGSKWNKKIILRITEAPTPCVAVNPFPLEIGC